MQTADVVAFSESIKFIEDLGIKNIKDHENEVLQYCIEKLKKNNSVEIIGDPKERGSVISFTMKGTPPRYSDNFRRRWSSYKELAIIVVKFYITN